MKKLLLVFTAIVLVFSMTSVVFAHDVPDPSRRGSIQVVMHWGDTMVGGGTLMIYRVGAVREDDGNYSFVPTGDFADWGEAFENIQAPELAEELKAYAMSKHLIGQQKTIAEDGQVIFDDLDLGLYLLVQYQAAPGYSEASPFLVSVPRMENGEYQYDVNASPKVELTPEPTEPSEPTTPPTEPEPSLPQTGQLNWPIPILATAGLVLFAAGWVLYSMQKKDSYEK